jgi:acylphosphatase
LAVGDEAALARLAEWLGHGPAQARVDRVIREPAREDEASEGFVCG